MFSNDQGPPESVTFCEFKASKHLHKKNASRKPIKVTML